MRIRTIKPEWLDDERLVLASSDARVLSIGLILLSDDYGNGRAHPSLLRSRVLPSRSQEDFDTALAELREAGFVELYAADGQSYFHVRNWEKHQRVDKPGKPLVPPPSAATTEPDRSARTAYFVRGTVTGLIKIGTSIDPVRRLAELAKNGSEPLDLLAIGGDERDLHQRLSSDRVHGEWFRDSPAVRSAIAEHGGTETPIASAGYAGHNKTLDVHGKVPEQGGNIRARLATDRDRDQDLNRDLDHTRRVSGPVDTGTADAVARVFGEWVRAFGLSPARTKLTPKRSRAIKARLAEFTADELCALIALRAADPWRREDPVRFELATLLRNHENVELALSKAPAPDTPNKFGPPNMHDTSDLGDLLEFRKPKVIHG